MKRSGWIRTAMYLALAGAAACSGSGDDETPGEDGGDAGGAGGDGGDGGGGGDAAGPCTTAELFAGNPLYTGTATDIVGDQPLKPPVTQRPLFFHSVALHGNNIYTVTQNQVWYADTTAATPTLKKVFGSTAHGTLRAGSCVDATIDLAENIAALPDGSLVVADWTGNALMKVTDPTGPSCAVSFLAGASATRTGLGTMPEDPDDIDGPGLTARFNGPQSLAVGPDGSVYFLDIGNEKVKKVAPDAAATVTTVATLDKGPGDATDWTSLTLRGGKLYAGAGTFSPHSYVVEIDPATGGVRTHSKTEPVQFPILDEDGRTSETGAVASDGERLFAAGGGMIWQVKDDGSIVHAAGGYSTKDLFDGFPTGVDFGAKVPARQAALKPYGGFEQYMTWHGDSLYWVGSHDLGRYVMKVTCPK